MLDDIAQTCELTFSVTRFADVACLRYLSIIFSWILSATLIHWSNEWKKSNLQV